jgi:N-acetylglucosamine repressor
MNLRMRHVASIRDRDKAVMLDMIRRFGPLSRVEIHEFTRIRPASISQLTRELIGEGRILEAGLSDNPTGRKQILLKMNENAGTIVAVDFDADRVSAAAVDCRPAILGQIHFEPSDLSNGVEGLIAQLFRCAREVMRQSGADPSRIIGLGVGDPGTVDPREGRSVLSTTIEFWRDVPLRERFEREFGLPCIVESNTRARTIAEQMLGAGGRSEDMIFVEYGWGIGAGMISGGRVILGHNFGAGEFGHTHVTESGPPCKCGSFGCLEATVGIAALASRARRAIEEGGFSRCLEMAGGDAQAITGWQVLEAAEKGDKMSIALVEEIGEHLGLGIANLVNLFNPALIVLDKRLAVAGELVLDQIRRVVRRQALAACTGTLEFRFGTLGQEASLLGVALQVLEAAFEVPALKPPHFLVDRSLEPGARRSNGGKLRPPAGPASLLPGNPEPAARV